MTNRGGFRCYVDAHDRDIPKDSDAALFMMQMDMPPNNPVALKNITEQSGGDATVPVSSSAILDALETVSINKGDASYLVRDHEPIYKTKTAQDITFNAIENLGRHKIKKKMGLA